MNFKNKKILLVGLGILGGGEATAKFLVENGARLTITDFKNEKELGLAVSKLKKKGVNFILGKHRQTDFKNNEIIVFNPAVSVLSPWIRLAKKYKKETENDFTLFLKFLKSKKFEPDYIAVTGTRGKTTVATWINYFLENSLLGGNMPARGFFKILKDKIKLFVLEISSFQLEFMKKGLKPPKVAIITNFYVDHLNRHKTLKNYLKEKSKIFLNQTKKDYLVLNADNKYTADFLKHKPRSAVYYFSLKPLSAGKSGIFLRNSKIYFREKGDEHFVCRLPDLASHQKSNLLASLLVSYLYKKEWDSILRKIKILPSVPFRQEEVFRSKRLKIINDTAATSPDGAIAALENFGNKTDEIVLITGGTDKNLEFKELAGKIKKYIKQENLFLLGGSATKKLINELTKIKYFNKKGSNIIFDSLKDILVGIKKRGRGGIVLFSPASASFEKFKNEFDRGNKFNKLVRLIYGKNSK